MAQYGLLQILKIKTVLVCVQKSIENIKKINRVKQEWNKIDIERTSTQACPLKYLTNNKKPGSQNELNWIGCTTDKSLHWVVSN